MGEGEPGVERHRLAEALDRPPQLLSVQQVLRRHDAEAPPVELLGRGGAHRVGLGLGGGGGEEDQERQPERGEVVLEVEDNRPGIPPYKLEQIIEDSFPTSHER